VISENTFCALPSKFIITGILMEIADK